MRASASAAIGAGVGGLDFEELLRRTCAQQNASPGLALVGQRLVGAVAVDLQDAAKAGKMHGGPPVLAVGLVDIANARQLRVAPGPIVARVGPELAGLGLSPARIEHRRPRLVGEQTSPIPSISRTAAHARGEARRRRGPNQSASVERSSSTPWRA